MRICLFGGGGAGKSNIASRMFSEMKDRGISVEQVKEYVKAWAYQNRPVKEFDQNYLFAKQQHYEYDFLSNGVKNIITDCPCFLSAYYGYKYFGNETGDSLLRLNQLYDKKYPVFNIFIERGDKPFEPHGRYQKEEEAKAMDDEIWKELIGWYDKDICVKIPFKNKDAILEAILKICDR